MESEWLLCNRCPCGYRGDGYVGGEQCGDTSWVPSDLYRRQNITVQMHRRLSCKGRVWPEGSNHRRWDAERLRDWRLAAINAVIGEK